MDATSTWLHCQRGIRRPGPEQPGLLFCWTTLSECPHNNDLFLANRFSLRVYSAFADIECDIMAFMSPNTFFWKLLVPIVILAILAVLVRSISIASPAATTLMLT